MEEPEPFNFTRDVVEAHALDKRRVALRFVDAQGVIDRRTFDDVAGAAGQWASFLRARGLMPGDRVLLLLGPTAVWPAVLLAVVKAGGVAVPCPEAISNDELELRLRQSGARLLVIDRHRAATLSAVDEAVEVIVCEEVASDVRGLVTVQPTHDTMTPDPAFILSPACGSEAHVSHRFTYGAILQAERGLDVRPDDLVWCAAETGSATSVWDGLLVPWAAGAAIVIHGAGPDPQQRLDLIHRLGVTVLRQAPDGFRQMTEYPVENGELDSVRRAVAVGGPLDPGVAEAFRSMSGLTVLEETEDKVFERSGSLEAPTVAANALVDTLNDRVSAATTTPSTTNGQADATEVMPPGAAGALGALGAGAVGSGKVVARDEAARDEAARAKAAAAEARRVEEERLNAERQEAERHVAERKAAEQRRAEEARRAAEAQATEDVRRRKEQEKEAAKEARLAERRAEEERKAAAAQAEIDARERKRQEAAAAAAAQEARRAAEAQAKEDVRRRKEQEKEAAKEARLAERRAEEERKAAAAQAEIDARERKRQEAAAAAEAQRAAQEARRAAEAQAKEDVRRRKEQEKEAAKEARLAERRAEEERKAAAAQAEIDARERKRQEAAAAAEAQRAAQEARRAAEAQAKEDERRRKEQEKAAATRARRDEADRRAAAEAEQRRLAEQARADAKRPPDEPRADPPAPAAAATSNGGGEDEQPDDGPNERLMERLRAYTHHANDATDDPPPQ